MWPWVAGGLCAAVVIAFAARSRPARPPLGALAVSLCLVARDQAERIEGMVADLVALSEALGPGVTDVVVVDDASADGTDALLQRLQRRYPPIKTLRWPEDAPHCADALEAACALCAGRWILLRQARGPRADGRP